jgi:hypothetical protein
VSLLIDSSTFLMSSTGSQCSKLTSKLTMSGDLVTRTQSKLQMKINKKLENLEETQTLLERFSTLLLHLFMDTSLSRRALPSLFSVV